MPVHIFLDSSAMPRYLLRPGHAYDRLIELVQANLAKVYASTVTVGEWRSQMVLGQKDGLNDMYKGLRTLMRQDLAQQLSQLKQLQELEGLHDATESEMDQLTSAECDKLLRRLDLTEVDFKKGDARAVFNDYFAGRPPFANPKHRQDLPDAFILVGASGLAQTLFPNGALAVCRDDRLREALGSIPNWKALKDLGALMETEELKEANTHLALYNAWTPSKERQILGFLCADPPFIGNAIERYAESELAHEEFTDSLIPSDNNVAMIDFIEDLRDIKVDWSKRQVIAPGWVFVPFSLKCDAQLWMQIYRSDTFSMPDWIHVKIGDFEHDHYFEATANRTLVVTGALSLQFTKEDIEKQESGEPSGVEFEDVDISIVRKRNERDY